MEVLDTDLHRERSRTGIWTLSHAMAVIKCNGPLDHTSKAERTFVIRGQANTRRMKRQAASGAFLALGSSDGTLAFTAVGDNPLPVLLAGRFGGKIFLRADGLDNSRLCLEFFHR